MQGPGDGVCPLQEQHASLGEVDAPGAPEQQGTADLGLQSLQLLTDGRLGPTELSGRATERAGPGDRAEDEHTTRIHASK